MLTTLAVPRVYTLVLMKCTLTILVCCNPYGQHSGILMSQVVVYIKLSCSCGAQTFVVHDDQNASATVKVAHASANILLI